MKKVILSLAIGLLSATSFAQGGKWGATAEDSIECRKNTSVYQQQYEAKNFTNALPYWKKVVELCPSSSYGVYYRGRKMYAHFVEQEQDAARKEQLVDSVLLMSDLAMKYFPEDSSQYMSEKARDLLKYRKDEFRTAQAWLKQSLEIGKENADCYAPYYYYTTLYSSFSAREVGLDVMISEYFRLMDLLDAIDKANPDDDTKACTEWSRSNIKRYVQPISTEEKLISFCEKKIIGDDKDNIEKIKEAAQTLDGFNYTKSDFYLELAVKMHKVEPSQASAESLAKAMLSRKEYSKALGYYSQAIEMCGDNCETEKLNEYLLYGGYAAQGARNYSKMKGFARKMLAIDSKSGQAYLFLAQCIAAKSKDCGKNTFEQKAAYWLAYDYARKAKSLDPEIAERASQDMARYKKGWPTVEEQFTYYDANATSYSVGCWNGESTECRH